VSSAATDIANPQIQKRLSMGTPETEAAFAADVTRTAAAADGFSGRPSPSAP